MIYVPKVCTMIVCCMMDNSEKNTSQKKFLATQKQLRVWIKPNKYELFKEQVEKNDTSIYAVINDFIDSYIINTKAED